MIIIKDKETLIKALFSVDEQGIFEDINYFLDNKIIISCSKNYYEYVINKTESIRFFIKKNLIICISFLKYNSNQLVGYRDNDLPALITFGKTDEVLAKQWFFNGEPYRDSIFKPISIEKTGEQDYIFNYNIDKKSIISVSYVLVKNNTIINGKFFINNQTVELSKLIELFPDLPEITFDDCYDLSVNIFTPELVNLYRMLYI